MSAKTSDEKIEKIREMRKNGYAIGFICNAVSVSSYVVSQCCNDIKVDLRYKKPSIEPLRKENPCKKYNFSELSLDDQKRYLECSPPKEDAIKKVFIFGNKGVEFEEVFI